MLSRRTLRRLRLLLGASAGALMSLVILLPELNLFLSIIIKLAGSALIVLISYKIRSVKEFIRFLLSFLLANFALAGVMLAIELTANPNGLIYKNGTVYYDIDLKILILLTVISYLIISLIVRLIKPSAPKKSLCEAVIEIGSNKKALPALIDTGNSLSDGFSGDPVIIADFSAIKEILPHFVLPFFENLNTDSLKGTPWERRVRLIPYGAIGNDGVLPALRPDKLRIISSGKVTETSCVLVAVSRKPLSRGEYQVILNPSILN